MTYHRKSLESEVPLVAEVIWRLSLADDDNVLDTNTETAVGVIAGFYRL